jgi:rare lipoprotein A (peptidoglycan hydrolase)
MKAKTKKKLIHLATKKRLVKKKTSKHILRTFLIGLSTLSVGSLAYAITMTKPTVGVATHAISPGGVQIAAPVVKPHQPTPQPVNGPAAQSGRGSWYALGLPAPDALTCASRTFPRGTHLHVKNLYNGRTIICRVNDYGPEAWTGRVIDLSRGSFRALDNLGRGTIPVEIRVAGGPTGKVDSPTEGDIGALVGYSLCTSTHDPKYCEAHRQDIQ